MSNSDNNERSSRTPDWLQTAITSGDKARQNRKRIREIYQACATNQANDTDQEERGDTGDAGAERDANERTSSPIRSDRQANEATEGNTQTRDGGVAATAHWLYSRSSTRAVRRNAKRLRSLTRASGNSQLVSADQRDRIDADTSVPIRDSVQLAPPPSRTPSLSHRSEARSTSPRRGSENPVGEAIPLRLRLRLSPKPSTSIGNDNSPLLSPAPLQGHEIRSAPQLAALSITSPSRSSPHLPDIPNQNPSSPPPLSLTSPQHPTPLANNPSSPTSPSTAPRVVAPLLQPSSPPAPITRDREAGSSQPLPDFIPFRSDVRDMPLESSPNTVHYEGLPYEEFSRHIDSTILSVVEGFKAEIQKQKNHTSLQNPFDAAETVCDKWRWAVLLETATCVLNQVSRDDSLEDYPYSLLAAKASVQNSFLQVFRRTALRVPPTAILRAFDCILYCGEDERAILSLCIADEDLYTVSRSQYRLIPAIVLHVYQPRELRVKRGFVLSLTSMRNDILAVEALKILAEPQSRLEKTISTICTGDTEDRKKLWEANDSFLYRRQRLESKVIRKRNFPFRNHHAYHDEVHNMSELSHYYIEALFSECGLINRYQFDALFMFMEATVRWDVNRFNERIPELQQIFVAEGVPGCGKTYTIAYGMSAFVLQYYPHSLIPEHRNRNTELSGHVFVLGKTNKALDVLCDRFSSVRVFADKYHQRWHSTSLPYYCSRSATYKKDRAVPAHRLPHRHPLSSPILLSTFGNLLTFFRELTNNFQDGMFARNFSEYIAKYVKAIVIDEGSQVSFLDICIFLKLFPSFDGIIFIFGDRRQYGPVVMSNWNEVKQYMSRSALNLLQYTETPFLVQSTQLKLQYRMSPSIMVLANDVSYHGIMEYGEGNSRHGTFPVSELFFTSSSNFANIHLGPVVCVSTSHETGVEYQFSNFVNWGEMKLTMAYVDLLTCGENRICHPNDIVFLTPYAEQCNAMTRLIEYLRLPIKVHTVISYQGEESDVVIFSAVRTEGTGVGFVSSEELVTVAITRARLSLIILGDLTHLANFGDGRSIWSRIRDSFSRRQTKIHTPTEVIAGATHGLYQESLQYFDRYHRR